jgi:hypothetical protein
MSFTFVKLMSLSQGRIYQGLDQTFGSLRSPTGCLKIGLFRPPQLFYSIVASIEVCRINSC